MKAKYTRQDYCIERLENGIWVWCACRDSADDGKAKLPQELYDWLAHGLPGTLTTVEGETYRIRLAERS